MRPRLRALLITVAVIATSAGLGVQATAAHGAPGLAPFAEPVDDRPDGNDDEPQGKPKDKGNDKPKGKPKPKPDRTPPAAPALGGPRSGAGGLVSLAVRAESGSRVVVRSAGGSVVATGTGTGGYQTLSWRASTGSHAYVVRATDKAGNTSKPSRVTAYADATPPALRGLVTGAGDREDTRARIAFTTSTGAAYRILLGERVLRRGTAGQDRVTALVDVPNGRHQVRVEARDRVGNLAVTTAALAVRIPRLAARTRLTSDATDTRQVLRVRATPTATGGVLRVPGEGRTRFRMDGGTGDVRLRLDDGTYDGATVTVRDRYGRTGKVELPELIVDTTPPNLQVALDEVAGAEGRLVLAVTADADAAVGWRLLDAGGATVAEGRFTATGAEQTVEEDVPEGAFELVVGATDEYDRTTYDVGTTDVGPDPRPAGFVVAVVAAVALLVAGALLGPAYLLWRYRRRVHRLAGRLRLWLAAGIARLGTGAERRRVRDEQLDAEAAWWHRHDELLRFLEVTHGEEAGEDPAAGSFLAREVDPIPDEHVLFATPATLLEGLDDPAAEVEPTDGELVVTTKRLAFVGPQERSWWHHVLEDLQHEGAEATIIRERYDDSTFGVVYAEPEVTRLYLDYATAERPAERAARVAEAEQLLEQLEREHPDPSAPQTIDV